MRNLQPVNRPHIVLVIARGEAVRNFLYSDTLPALSSRARLTLLTLVDHGEVIERVRPYVGRIIPLHEYAESRLVTALRSLVHTAHYRWLWSENARHMWSLHDARAKTFLQKFRRLLLKILAGLLANPPSLEVLTRLNAWLTWVLRPGRELDDLFKELEPDLVFNGSHIHGPQADLPLYIAQRMGIKTATFVFSWDNLTTRSRIFVPYDAYLMWNNSMKSLLLSQYPYLQPSQVIVTGTPQFDYHFKPEFLLHRETLCARLGIDPARPVVLYTTGMDTDFLDEHKFIQEVISILKDIDIAPRPQLVVRTYIKGTSPEIQALARQANPDVVFPPILWDRQWVMPLYEDLALYSSLLHHCALGINAASTVSLELMMLNKPVINLGMEPPGSELPAWEKFSRHVSYEHYLPVARSGGVMVAKNLLDLREMIFRGLTYPLENKPLQDKFMHSMMGNTLDGNSGLRVAEALLDLARPDTAKG